jgi:competence protein ComEC
MTQDPRYFWNQVPLFRVIWLLLTGIISAIFYPDLELTYFGLGLLVAISIFYLLSNQRSMVNAALLGLAFFVVGYSVTCLNTDRLFEKHYSKKVQDAEANFIGMLSSDPIERKKSIKAEFDIEAIVSESDTTPASGKILVYFEKGDLPKQVKYNDKLIIHGRLNEIQEPKNPGEFNYKRYIHFHQISHQIYLPGGSWESLEQGRGFIRLMKNWQHDVIQILESHEINDRELAIVSALLVGYKHYLSADQVNAFASAGAIHVLAVSGLHVGIIFLIINSLLSPLLRIRHGRVAGGILLFVALWGYAAITGMSPSVTRAAAMFSFVIGAQLFDRHTDIFNTLVTSASALLLYNPFLIVEVGFQLSYLAVIGIVLIQPTLQRLWEPKWWLLEKIWGITTVSIAAQVATFPLGLLYFHQFPNYFLLSNLVVIPLATLILPVGISLVVFHAVPIVNSLLGQLLYALVHFLDLFISWVEKLPAALIQGIDVSIFETYFIYLIVVSLSIFLIRKSYPWLVIFLLTLCVIEGFNILESIQQSRQSALVIYSIRNHEAMDIVLGHAHQFVADTSLSNDFDNMRFHIHQHWWHRDLSPPQLIPWNTGLHFFEDKIILSLDDSTLVDSTLGKIDVLHITQRTAQHPDEILDFSRPRMVVLSQNLDWKTQSYWQYRLDTDQYPYVNLKTKAAFVISD